MRCFKVKLVVADSPSLFAKSTGTTGGAGPVLGPALAAAAAVVPTVISESQDPQSPQHYLFL